MMGSKSFTKMAMLAAALAAIVGSSGQASASVITYESRSATSIPTFTDSASYIDYYNSLTPTTTTSVDTWAGLSSPDEPFASLTTVAFYVATAGIWNFQIGEDFGHGGTVLLDGVAVETSTSDLWWGGATLDSSTASFEVTQYLSTGTHTLQVIGVESCCNGATEAEFLAPTSTIHTVFSKNDGLVPEPATWMMLLVGFGMIGFMLRRENSNALTAAV